MNFLYLHQHFTTPDGASGTRSYEFARRYAEKGTNVTVICGHFGAGNTGLTGSFRNGVRQGIVDGIKVIELELPYDNKQGFIKRSITFIRFALRTLALIHKVDKPDLIYASSTPLTVAIPALWSRLVLKVPYVFEVRDLWPELPKAMGVVTNPLFIWFLDRLESVAYRYASACVGLSPGMVDGIRKKQSAVPVVLIPNGCDIELFEHEKSKVPTRNSCEGNKSSTSKKFNFVYAGTIGLANDLDAIVRALSLIAPETSPNIHFDIIGDGARKSELMQRISALNLESFFTFHGSIPKVKLAKYLGSFDAGILTLKDVDAFYYGTSPNKFFDYISAGLPVICNHPGWVADMLKEYEAGLSCEAGDSGEFAKMILLISSLSSSKIKAMSNNALVLAERFNRGELAEKQIALCESLIKK